MIEEELLRENIRKAIRIIKERHNKKEEYIRTIIRHLLKEETVIKYEFTVLNHLADCIQSVIGDINNPDGKQAFKKGFTDLTSSSKERELFTEYIIDFANIDFETIDADQEPKTLGPEFVEKGFVDDEEEIEADDEEEGTANRGDDDDDDDNDDKKKDDGESKGDKGKDKDDPDAKDYENGGDRKGDKSKSRFGKKDYEDKDGDQDGDGDVDDVDKRVSSEKKAILKAKKKLKEAVEAPAPPEGEVPEEEEDDETAQSGALSDNEIKNLVSDMKGLMKDLDFASLDDEVDEEEDTDV